MFCSHCGEELPRDDTRFCSNCGAVRTTRIANPSSITGTDRISQPAVPENVQAVSNPMEQAAPMPPLRMKPHTNGEEFPTWMSRLQRNSRNEQALKDKSQQILAPQQQEAESQGEEYPGQQYPGLESVAYATVAERPMQSQDAHSPEQLNFPDLPSTPQSFSPAREAHVKIWNEANSIQGKAPSKEEILPQGDRRAAFPKHNQDLGAVVREERAVEDVPTQSVESVAVGQSQQASFSIDDIPTTPLLIMPGGQPQSLSGEQPQPLQGQNISLQQKPEQVLAKATDIARMSTVQLQVQGQNQVASSTVSQVNHPIARGAVLPSAFGGGKGRSPLIIGATAVLLLLALALGSWILVSQPFSVSPATNVQQTYADTKLGVSLRYPSEWKTPQVDYNKKVITLLDASDTARINIQIANATTGSQASYLQQQATKLGITNPKPADATTFAGVSWQEIQGDMQVKGAGYTCALFTAIYKNHLYTLTQMAPRSVYADEEKLVFSPTRLSLHFL